MAEQPDWEADLGRPCERTHAGALHDLQYPRLQLLPSHEAIEAAPEVHVPNAVAAWVGGQHRRVNRAADEHLHGDGHEWRRGVEPCPVLVVCHGARSLPPHHWGFGTDTITQHGSADGGRFEFGLYAPSAKADVLERTFANIAVLGNNPDFSSR